MVSRIVEAVCENGVLRPMRPLSLAEHETVRMCLLDDGDDSDHHAHISRTAGVCGGRPAVRGTRVSVRTIGAYDKIGATVDEILDGMAHLTAA